MTSPTGIGIWAPELRFGDPATIRETAPELEALGYSALWIPDVGGPVLDTLDLLLDTTSTATIATGVINVWRQSAADIAQWWQQLPDRSRQRLMLGIGISHAPLIGDSWGRPLETTTRFLDDLDAGGIPAGSRCIGALGPKMLDLARRRTAGALPYLVSPEHTALAREALGDDAGLFVEQGVVLSEDPDVARATARAGLDYYVNLPNYANNWRRLGFSDDDIATRSDRLVDALFAWGDVDAIGQRVERHRQAGADHVCLQVLNPPGTPTSHGAWRALAALCG